MAHLHGDADGNLHVVRGPASADVETTHRGRELRVREVGPAGPLAHRDRLVVVVERGLVTRPAGEAATAATARAAFAAVRLSRRPREAFDACVDAEVEGDGLVLNVDV